MEKASLTSNTPQQSKSYMPSVNFCFATHNHQPIGNFDHIIEEAYQRSYLPFFELAEKYPIRFGTHFTGILLDWLQEKHPEHVQRLRAMVERGQLEMISGGYYEPILSVIPPPDQLAQIARLTDRLVELFGTNVTGIPSGMWLAERVWEQPLAHTLHEAGIRYVLLDDTHFLAAGLREDQLTGYYLTEDRGRTLAVFPISKALRYTIPFASVDETIRVLRDAASEDGKNIVCFADDGEKFGVWPRTFDHVYRDGWLEELFRKLGENSSWIRMLHLSEAIEQVKPVGRIYLPNASYAEMMQWALPTASANQSYEDFIHLLEEAKEQWQEYLPFVRGGYWRNFFAKYPETNQLHKHMLRTSGRIEQLAAAGHAHEGKLLEAYDALLSAQCNDPYWHGVFGGAYLTNLRHANFSALVRADALLDEVEDLTGIRATIGDVDCDGDEEVVIETRLFSLYIKPSLAGMIAELDFKPCSFNAMNAITRQEEAYHQKITQASAADASVAEDGANDKGKKKTKSIHDMVETKEEGLEKLLAYDWYRHGCMIEHILGPNVTVEEMQRMQFEELGDFVTSGFERSWKRESGSEHVNGLCLQRLGRVWQHGAHHPLRLTKVLDVASDSNELRVKYQLRNESRETLSLRFASEWLFNLLAGNAHDRYYESNGVRLEHPTMNSSGVLEGASNIRMVDEFLRLSIEIDAEGADSMWRLPIESVSLSEAGFERVYQGSLVLPVWSFELPAGTAWQTSMAVRFSRLP